MQLSREGVLSFLKKKDFICFPPYYNMIRFIYLCMYLAELGLSFGMRDL